MPPTPPALFSKDNRYGKTIFLILIVAGLAGNYFKFPLFLNIDFLFGSIFAMLALQLFGVGRGIAAAALIAGYTYILWNHPYAIIIMTAEVAVVSWLMGRRKIGMVLADTLYWLLVGMPFVYLFYHFFMHVPSSSTHIAMTKQAVNGIANALIARMIFTAYALKSHKAQMSYREIIYTLLSFFVLCPALITLVIDGRADFIETDQHIRTTLIQDSQLMHRIAETWVISNNNIVVNLAEMAASKSPQQMQAHLEQAKKSSINFLRIGLQNREATTTAIFPLIDDLGKSAIGINYADRPYIPQLKQTFKPMLSEVVMRKIGTPKPIVSILAPVTMDGKYGGYVIGVLDMEQLRKHLSDAISHLDTLYSMIDKNGNVVMTNRTNQIVMKPFVHGRGSLNRLDDRINQWIPELPPNTPVSERWKKSFYVAETGMDNLSDWRLILEQPVAPFQKMLYINYTGKITILFFILLGALALAELLSRRIVVTLGLLRTLTNELPVKLLTKVDSSEIHWPESGIEEITHLIANFREMADLLLEQLNETRHINETLEQRVEKRTNELASIMQELNIILENAPIGIAKLIDRKQVWVNRKLEDIFLYSKEEMDLVTTRFLYPSDEAYEKLGQEAYPILSQGLLFESVQEMVRKDQAHVLVRFIGKAIDPTDMSKGALWLSEDVTGRKLAEEELRKAKEQAETANRAKSEFLANMSHEIRTPLNGVIGMAQLLAMGDLTEEQRLYVDALKDSGKNLMALINDILDLSKIESGIIVIEAAGFSLRHCINDVVMTQKSVMDEKGLVLEVDLAEDIPHVVVGDQLRVRQIFLNLLGNAVKFTNNGGISVTARLLEQQESSVVIELAVSDSGIGILPEAIDKIFMPFVQEDGSTTRQFGGTGLGLTISRRLADLMGGSITVESNPGVGSCFRVAIPFDVIGNTDLVEKTAQSAADSWDGPPLRILFVDDQKINIAFGMALLEKLGHDLVTATNGRECLTAMEQDTFDLVLLDIQMPVMNGEDALFEIRKNERARGYHQPVIALTAYALSGEKERFMEQGFDGYVSKPLAVEELVAEMKRVMAVKTDLNNIARGNYGRGQNKVE